jgi:hypothetical protein
MMNKIIMLILVLLFSSLNFMGYSQCEPLTPEQCPDPENNGEVCPDSLQPAFLNQFYSQVATIKPPAIYYMPPDSTVINLHHVKLMKVENLPEGITWQSNTTDSIFVAGEYYCVLMEGDPDSAGVFPLKIVVDVYVLIFNIPVKVATAVDSTSLAIEVIDDSGIHGFKNDAFYAEQNIPNPFRSVTRIRYYSDKQESVIFEVFSLVGEKVYREELTAEKGENLVVFNGSALPRGTYFYKLHSDRYQSGGMMIRAD